jgi:hypothetical protein
VGEGGELFLEQTLVGGGVVGVDESLMPLLQRQRCCRQGELIVVQLPLDIELDIEVGFHQVLITLALRAFNGLMPELQPCTDGFKVVGGVGATAV